MKINEKCQVQKCGEILANLYAIGSVIGGYNNLELGCSSGVAVVTALTVAEQILAGANNEHSTINRKRKTKRYLAT